MRFVQAEQLEEGMILGRDIISSKNQHMLRKGVVLRKEYILYIQLHGYIGAYIVDDGDDAIEYEENTVGEQLFLKGIQALEKGNIGALVSVATEIADTISSSPSLHMDLMDLRSYDDYTYHHSVNVAVFATMIGKKMKIKDDKLNLLCQAALCHDLGKTKISLDILNKPGKLTDEEFALIKDHPKGSFEILSNIQGISAIVKQAVYFHHENENGSGYPTGKAGNDIPLFAKIIHVVDVYDALTSRRPYKEPYSSADALDYLKTGSGILFDKFVVDIVEQTIPAYPPGIEVNLSNGMKATVVGHSTNALRPVIRIPALEETIDLSKDEHYQNIQIVSSTQVEFNYVNKIEALNESRQAVKERKLTIAIVDDVKMSRIQARNSITGDYNFLFMESGLELVSYMEHRKVPTPDLIILDIEMPILDGIQTADKIRVKGHHDVPIIFLTAANDTKTILACRQFGNVDYVLKPANPMYLNERVEVALGHRRDQ